MSDNHDAIGYDDRCGWMREGGDAQCRLVAGHERTHDWGDLPTRSHPDDEDASDNEEGAQAVPDMPTDCR